jgi:hypothetical protein
MDEGLINEEADKAANAAADAFRTSLTQTPNKRKPYHLRDSTKMYQQQLKELAVEMDRATMEWARQNGRDLPLGSIIALIDSVTTVAIRHAKQSFDIGIYAETMDAHAPAEPAATGRG